MKVTGVRTYDSLNEKWKNLRRKMAHFCGVYNNATRRAQSGAGHGYYTHKTLEGDKVMKKATTSSMPLASLTDGSDEALARACLSSSWALVLDNGSPTLEFSIKHGLRQGDPLSPFLFIVAIERLHNTLSTAVSSGLIRGVKFDSPEIFYLASGLKINIQKSNVYGMGFRMSISLPCPVLLDKFQSKLSSWKANLISIGGCHTLIKVVLSSLDIYYFSIFKVPESVLNSLERSRTMFFWGVALEVVIAQERALVKVIKALHGFRVDVKRKSIEYKVRREKVFDLDEALDMENSSASSFQVKGIHVDETRSIRFGIGLHLRHCLSYRTKEDDVAKISTSVFITNFPESLSAKELFQSCKQYGHVVDTFIPTKRSKNGKRFGFVRFINVFNEERLVNNLCTVWIDRFKLHANIARFHRPPVSGNKHVKKDGEGVKSNMSNLHLKVNMKSNDNERGAIYFI
ncbi:nucleotide-binding alpha-beta plait domain-containing protein [Tanacetum coccineum]|uniref:Nucleotide-binding alpha-beta plait domain-containing protein n=1 Tax=Tanacetum coccineum TaxID=301880 RepID=A0ABQ4XCV5_9ASTR